MDLTERFRSHIDRSDLFSMKDKLLLAVSGGVDSVVLSELCYRAGYDFRIAHCNFRLRGEESERDERFVRQLGEHYKVAVLVKQFDTEKYATDNKVSIQEAARALRYAWFAELTGNKQLAAGDNILPIAQYVLTAHHADDNIETVLMHFFRGTGLHGLTGIPAKPAPANPMHYIRRPLLEFSREEIEQFAKTHHLSFVEDSSNQSVKYTRNFFRHEIIPAIRKVYPQVKENIRDNIERFRETEKLYQHTVGELKKKLCRQKGGEVHVPVRQLMGFNSRALVYELISGYGFSEKQVEEVYKLAESDSGRFMESPDHLFRIIKHRHWFIISPVVPAIAENIIIESGEHHVQLAVGSLQLQLLAVENCPLPTTDAVACLDAKDISFPLLLRRWKQGDYFYPLGMKKKKKLSRFLIDQKLSKTDKEKIWVIEMNKKIIWVVGYRIDERFKVTAKTKKVLRVTIS